MSNTKNIFTIPSEQTLPILRSSGFSNIEIREIKKLDEKRKWMNRFIKNYKGHKTKLTPALYGEYCRYFVSSVDGKDIGYIRIINYSENYKEHISSEVWNASDAYVKPCYRNQLVLKEMLEYVIRNCNVKMVRLETERLFRCWNYYESLGFTSPFRVGNGDISIAVTDEMRIPFLKVSRN